MTTYAEQLNQQLAALGESPSTQDLLALQFQMSQLSVTQSAVSALMKETADMMKSIIQKL